MKPSIISGNTKDSPIRKYVIRILAVLFWLVVWQLASSFIAQDILLVSPLTVLKTLFQMVGDGGFWQTIWFSFSRITRGFFIAMAAGTLLAVAAAAFRPVRELLAPPIAVINATPIASFIILLLVWINTKNIALAVSFLMVLPVIYTNVLQGIQSTDKKLLEMARVYKVSPLKKITYIYFSNVLPFFVSACSVALGMSWKSGIAAEVIGIPAKSIGEKLYQSKLYLMTDHLFAWTIVIIIISVIFEKLVMFLLFRLKRLIESR